MKIIPSWRALRRTLLGALLASSLLTNMASWYCWKVYEERWDEVVETAEFNDLDGDGQAWVLIVFE